MRYIIIFIPFLLANVALAQFGNVKRAVKLMDKGDLEKAEELVDKALEKDSILSGALYMRSKLMIEYHHNIDSAHFFINKALASYTLLDEKDKQKHDKENLDSLQIYAYKEKIDSLAYQRAEAGNTENSFIYFLDNFKTADQRDRAIQRRNALAYESARLTNTYQSYHQFMTKYPEAVQVTDARRLYEKLYYEESTADGQLESYKRFLRVNPNTPYRREAEQRVFEMMTVDNKAESYLSFISDYPNGTLKSKAVGFLYHILKGENRLLPSNLVTDSLARVITQSNKVFVPIWKEGLYGFMDVYGNEVVAPSYEEIYEEELCGGMDRDYFLVQNKIISPINQLIYEGSYDQVWDLGMGLLKIRNKDQYGIVHKSGYIVLPVDHQDVKVLGKQFIAYQRDGKWGLQAISGARIVEPQYQDISRHEAFIIFENAEGMKVSSEKVLVDNIESAPFQFSQQYSDFEIVDHHHIWLEKGDQEGVLSVDMEEIVPFKRQQIRILQKGIIIHSEDIFYLLNQGFRPIEKEPASLAKYNAHWVTLKTSTGWNLYNLDIDKPLGNALDSVKFYGDQFVVSYKGDSTRLLTMDQSVELSTDDNLTLLSSFGSKQYLKIASARSERIINDRGEVLLEGKHESAKALGDEYLIYEYRGKKGLLSYKGEKLLKAQYDGIADNKNGYVSLLKDKKFGLYKQDGDVLIPPKYDRNITFYNDSVYIAAIQGKLGLIDRQNDRLTVFNYDHVEYWSDSAALLRDGSLWTIYNFKKDEIVDNDIKSLTFVPYTGKERLAIILKQDGYGVMSSTRGEFIPANFNDIVNIGTASEPIFFAEKHIPEANLYVVVYYDIRGEVIRRQTFDSDDYPKIYCDN